jgi:alpha-tubulin suppressor-like RCC1 family protein
MRTPIVVALFASVAMSAAHAADGYYFRIRGIDAAANTGIRDDEGAGSEAPATPPSLSLAAASTIDVVAGTAAAFDLSGYLAANNIPTGATISWSLVGAPSWATIQDGILTLRPTSADAGPHTLTVTASSNGATATQVYPVTVDAMSITLADASLPDVVVGDGWNFDFASLATYSHVSPSEVSWSIDGPNWLAIDPATGYASALPTDDDADQAFGEELSATVHATAADVGSARNYLLHLFRPALTLATVSLLDATVGTAWTQDFGTPAMLIKDHVNGPITWAVSGAPSWLAMNPTTGVLSGTPTAADVGTPTFTVTAAYKTHSGQQAYTISVGADVLRNVVRIAAGIQHTCAVLTDGTVRCWGASIHGELGNGSTTNNARPVLVPGLSNVVDISAGNSQTCAVLANGTVRCWGWNFYGQLGDGTTTDATTPVAVVGLTDAKTVAVGSAFTCALTTSGTVKCWGNNLSGQVGDGTTNNTRKSPVQVSGLSGVAAIAAGGGHACALTTGGAVKCWGLNGSGQIGDGSTTNRPSPVQVTGLTSGVAAISSRNEHTCALTTSGAVRCWGADNKGQLGDGLTANRTTPYTVPSISGATAITTGYAHTCAVVSGAVKCWGWNTVGQLGDGTTVDRPSPVTVAGGSGVAALSGGNYFTCALTSGGAVKCWGQGAYGQLGDGAMTNRSTAVDVVRQ